MSTASTGLRRTEPDEGYERTFFDGDGDDDAPESGSRTRGLASRLSIPALIVLVQGLLTGTTLLQVRDGLGARNLEASYHAILTAKAMLASPLSRHWGLPTVSLGQDNDKFVLWGATVATDSGDYIYTSFPPAGFWLPAVLGYLRGGDIGLAGLVALNGALALASGLLLYVLVVRAVGRLDRPVWTARVAGLAAAVVYLTSTEALQSHGPVYWPHSMLQPLLLGLLLVLDHLLTRPEGADRRKLLVVLGVLTAVACYTEWTAYVFAFLTGALILVVPWLRRRIMPAGLVLVAVAVATAAVLAAHFILVLGVDASVQAWKDRFLARSGSGSNTATLLDLQYGYALSFGGVILVVVVLLALAVFRPETPGRRDAVGGIIVLFSLTAVLENLLLRQHAMEFTFDRLKVGIPLALLVGLAIGHLSRRLLVLAGVVVCLGAAVGISAHRTDVTSYADWPYVDEANQALVRQAKQAIDLECATLGTNMQVRGYTNLLLDRAVHEFVEPEKLQSLAAEDDASCGTVYIRARSVHTDLPQFLSLTVVQPDGASRVFEAG